MHNLVAVSPTVYAHVGGYKNFGDAGALLPWDGGMVDPLETRYSHYHVLAHQISLVKLFGRR